MNYLVLSGAPPIVLSGAQVSCYQAHALPKNSSRAMRCSNRNGSNEEFFEFLSNLKPDRHPVDRFLRREITR
jgi:hypothetical protein